MLVLSKNDGTPIASFESFGELCQHITTQENSKLLPGHPEFGKSFWGFLVLSPERIANLINTLKKSYDEKILYDAWHRQLSIVEICEGNYEKVHQVIVEPNVNIEALREDWCVDYCEANGMSLTKVK